MGQWHSAGADPKASGLDCATLSAVSVQTSPGASQRFLKDLMQQDADDQAEAVTWGRDKRGKCAENGSSWPLPCRGASLHSNTRCTGYVWAGNITCAPQDGAV